MPKSEADILDILREKRSAAAQDLERIDKAIAVLEGTLATGKPARKFSQEARARMAESQRQRWAKAREGAVPPTPGVGET